MNKNILRKYYEMQGKIILPEEKGNNNIELAASAAANFASIGFPMTTDEIKKLAKADEKDILDFYKQNYEMLSEVIGAGKQPKPFYPDFPEGCMERSFARYFIDQVVYGLSGLTLEPSDYMKEKEKYPFIGAPMRRILQEGSMEDLDNTFRLAVNSAIAYSKEQREFIMEYVKEKPEAINALLENTSTKNRENAVTCAMMVEQLSGNSMNTEKFMKQPADLLRYAAFKSVEKDDTGRDPYQAIALRDKKQDMPRFAVGRKERAFIMDQLADMDRGNAEKLSNNMHGHDEEWNRLFKHLHITDKAWNSKRYDNVKQAIVYIQNDTKFDRPARRIEEAVKANDIDTAVKESAKMPGDFMRRFDKLYRMGLESEKKQLVLDALESVADKAGIATVTGTIGSLERRTEAETERYFKDKTGKVVKITDKNRKPFTPYQVKLAKDAALEGLSKKFAGKDEMGKVFISDSLKDVKIPADIRDNSGAVNSLTSGSKMPITADWNKMRFFISWTNLDGKEAGFLKVGNRVDIDLTVALCNENMKVVGFCGWNGEYRGDGYIYSGDVQDGGSVKGEGRAEFIDIDLDKLKANGIAYVVPQISSFTCQKFSEQPHTCFGVMKRTDNDMGENFEPASVVNRFVLDCEATQASPYVIDVRNREILWMNEKTQENVALRGLDNMLNTMARAQNSKTMPLNLLVEANAKALGEIVDRPDKADLIFVRDTDEMQDIKENYQITDDGMFKLSNNMEYITGFLMQEGHPTEREKEEPVLDDIEDR